MTEQLSNAIVLVLVDKGLTKGNIERFRVSWSGRAYPWTTLHSLALAEAGVGGGCISGSGPNWRWRFLPPPPALEYPVWAGHCRVIRCLLTHASVNSSPKKTEDFHCKGMKLGIWFFRFVSSSGFFFKFNYVALLHSRWSFRRSSAILRSPQKTKGVMPHPIKMRKNLSFKTSPIWTQNMFPARKRGL